MLEYENQLFLEAVNENELYIFAKGILTPKVLTNICKLYSSEESLVFVLNTNSNEEGYFIKELGDNPKIKSITSEFNAAKRKELYIEGGLYFITARILIVDLLKEVVPIEKITGILVMRAHNVIENSQEAFILRLYRTKNKTGFIKAFSNSPCSFLLGYSRVNRVMRSCFLANLSLWPRFHASVKESLSKNIQNDSVVEIQLNMTEEMKEIQTNLLDLVTLNISELKRLVPALNDEEISVENSLTKNFHKIIDGLIDPVWNTIKPSVNICINELKLFRSLLTMLTKVDCVTFDSYLSIHTTRDAALKSSWVISDSAEKIIKASRIRYLSSSKKTTADSESSPSKNQKIETTFKPEVHPKWLALGEILNEICIKQEKEELNEVIIEDEVIGEDEDLFADLEEPHQSKKPRIENNSRPTKLKTIILAEDIKTCSVLRDFLSVGSELTLAKIASNCENIKIPLPAKTMDKIKDHHIEKKNEKERSKERRKKAAEAESEVNDDDTEESTSRNENRERQITLTQIQRKYDDVEFLQSPIFIRPIKTFKETEAFGITQVLEQIMPDVVILFDPTLEVIRNLEIHISRYGTNQNIRIYFLVFHNSIEEQLYLTSIQREKSAFERLIAEKANLLVPKEREGLDELNMDLWRDPTKANETVGTSGLSKRNMQEKSIEQEIILADMREFRSELPSLIHKRGINLEPITIDIGDYVLTPDICVERKSISDLIGSLISGRLYKQCEAMSRHYKKPILLIENEQQAQSGISSNKYKNDLSQIMPKLQILTLHFPKLKLIWSPGAHYTSELFHELKRGKQQPIPEQALSIQKEESGSYSESKFNSASHAFLSKMPGIDSRNVYSLLNSCDNLGSIEKLSVEKLSLLLENSSLAELLYSGFHSNLTANNEGGGETSTSSTNINKGSSRARANRGKK